MVHVALAQSATAALVWLYAHFHIFSHKNKPKKCHILKITFLLETIASKRLKSGKHNMIRMQKYVTINSLESCIKAFAKTDVTNNIDVGLEVVKIKWQRRKHQMQL